MGEDGEVQCPLGPLFDCWVHRMYSQPLNELFDRVSHPDMVVYFYPPPWIDSPGSVWKVQSKDIAVSVMWKVQFLGMRMLSGAHMLRKGRSWFEFRVKVRVTSTGETVDLVEGIGLRLKEGKVISVLRRPDWTRWNGDLNSGLGPIFNIPIGEEGGGEEESRDGMPALLPATHDQQQSNREEHHNTQQQNTQPRAEGGAPNEGLEEASATGNVPPCRHNDWDNIRGRRCWSQLRCRVCESNWRIPEPRPAQLSVCVAFRSGTCPDSLACGRLHIHRQRRAPVPRPSPATPETPETMAVGDKDVTKKEVHFGR
eukprot:Hpha_TRINITY_DN16299_c0_g1::TRINITY_DN16299_c0_g1_i2::g.14705::m.14705